MIQPADPGDRSDCGLASGKWDVERNSEKRSAKGRREGKRMRPPGCGSTSRLGENGGTRGFFRRFRPDRDIGDWQDERLYIRIANSVKSNEDSAGAHGFKVKRAWFESIGRERKPCVDCLFSGIGSAVCNGLSVPIAPCT